MWRGVAARVRVEKRSSGCGSWWEVERLFDVERMTLVGYGSRAEEESVRPSRTEGGLTIAIARKLSTID